MSMILTVIRELVEVVFSLLPNSPFREFLDGFGNLPYLGYLNWLIPIADFVKLLGIWCIAVSIFYVASMILRLIKVIT